MSQVTFTVYGKAEPQGSKKAFVVTDKFTGKPRAVVVDDNKPTMRSYRQQVTREAIRSMLEAGIEQPMAGKQVPVEMTLEFTFIKPESAKKRKFPAVTPDIDKLGRATMDALTGVLFADDAQVVTLTMTKVYGPQEQVHVSAMVMEDGRLF